MINMASDVFGCIKFDLRLLGSMPSPFVFRHTCRNCTGCHCPQCGKTPEQVLFTFKSNGMVQLFFAHDNTGCVKSYDVATFHEDLPRDSTCSICEPPAAEWLLLLQRASACCKILALAWWLTQHNAHVCIQCGNGTSKDKHTRMTDDFYFLLLLLLVLLLQLLLLTTFFLLL